MRSVNRSLRIRRIELALVFGTLVLIGASYGVDPERAESAKPCPIGEARPLDPDYIKIGLRPVAGPFVIGCPTLRHLGAVELVAYRDGRSLNDSALCVDTNFAPGNSQGRCTDADKRLHGLGGILSGGFGAFSSGRWLYLGDFAGPGV